MNIDDLLLDISFLIYYFMWCYKYDTRVSTISWLQHYTGIVVGSLITLVSNDVITLNA